MRQLIGFLCLFAALQGFAGQAEETKQRFQEIGGLRLASGETLQNVTLGYRLAGDWNDDTKEVIVFLTWFTGRTGDLLQYEMVGPGGLADTRNYRVVMIDALANGVSTSPSTSEKQPGDSFPEISMSDLVTSQHILLTRHLGLEQVHVVMGISMGGMQTFQWIEQYPGFMRKAIAIDGSPKLTSYDLLQWKAQLQSIELMHAAGVESSKIARHLELLNMLTLWTPDWFVENVSVESLPEMIEESVQNYHRIDPLDYAAQLGAIMHLDVFAPGMSVHEYSQKVEAEVMVVGVPSDQMVNPGPARNLAKELDATYVEIASICGHMATTSCEEDQLVHAAHAFIQQGH